MIRLHASHLNYRISALETIWATQVERTGITVEGALVGVVPEPPGVKSPDEIISYNRVGGECWQSG